MGNFLLNGMEAVAVCMAAAVAALWLLARANELARGRMTERLVVALYRWARWWTCMAVAADMALKHFREHRQASRIEPGYAVEVQRG